MNAEADMPRPETTSFLSRILLIDAAISGAAGVLMVAGATALAEWLAVPAGVLRYAGWSLLPFAVLVTLLSRRPDLPGRAVVAVIALNAAWVVASVGVLLARLLQPNALGYAFVLGQAAAVAVLTEMEAVGLRRES